jgi:glyoxylase-like metal-dependent hydrolase (beta-lactamase superfamily II)
MKTYRLGNFELYILSDGTFRLDGGAMFGIVPKTLWQKVTKPDEHNRILLGLNVLLIKAGGKNILCESGIGKRWDAKSIQIYDISHASTVEGCLLTLGLSVKQIDYVILSHLHFDHAGGLTTVVDDKIVPSFPNAKYIVQRLAYEEAMWDNERTKGSFKKEDLLILQDRLKLVDGEFKVCEGVWTQLTGGHCEGHQITFFESQGKKGVFVGDIIPTAKHIHPAWVMGYDLYPHKTTLIKRELLKKTISENWLVVFPHEIETPMGFIRQKNKKFYVEPVL